MLINLPILARYWNSGSERGSTVLSSYRQSVKQASQIWSISSLGDLNSTLFRMWTRMDANKREGEFGVLLGGKICTSPKSDGGFGCWNEGEKVQQTYLYLIAVKHFSHTLWPHDSCMASLRTRLHGLWAHLSTLCLLTLYKHWKYGNHMERDKE